MTKTPYFDFAIPVYNEELRLERGVKRLVAFCKENQFSAQITIADNGSKDKTPQIAERLMEKVSNLRLVRLGEKGVGRALKKVWDESKAEVVGYMDVDLSTDISHLLEVRTLFTSKSCDVVNGSRLLKNSKVMGRTLKREISSRAFNWLLRNRLGVGFTDGMCGFKFLTRESYQRIRARGVECDEWFFNTEILVKAEWEGLRLKEIAVRWEDDPHSNVSIFELAKKYYREIRRLELLKGEPYAKAA